MRTAEPLDFSTSTRNTTDRSEATDRSVAMHEIKPTRKRIREATVDLLAARGYGGTSMADIAQQVGLSKAGLYNYYRSKEELLLELLRHSIEAWRDASLKTLKDDGSVEQRLRRHFEMAVEFTTRQPATVTVMRVTTSLIDGDLGDRVLAIVSQYKAEYQRTLEGFFSQAIERGEALDAEPADLALAWRSFLDGFLRQLIYRQTNASDLQARVPRLWKILWRGLSGKPTHAP